MGEVEAMVGSEVEQIAYHNFPDLKNLVEVVYGNAKSQAAFEAILEQTSDDCKEQVKDLTDAKKIRDIVIATATANLETAKAELMLKLTKRGKKVAKSLLQKVHEVDHSATMTASAEGSVGTPKKVMPTKKIAEKVSSSYKSVKDVVSAALSGKEVPTSEITRFGWEVRTGRLPNGKAVNVFVKGNQVLARAGRPIAAVGKVLGKTTLPLQLLAIGADLYTGYGLMKGEAERIRTWKRRRGVNNPDDVSFSDFTEFTEEQRAAAHKDSERADKKSFETAKEKADFFQKAFSSLSFADGLVQDCQMFDGKLSKYNASAWDALSPGKLLGETLATADARNQEIALLSDSLMNNAARCRALVREISTMSYKASDTKQAVINALATAAILADNTVLNRESPLRKQSEAVRKGIHAARKLVRADRAIEQEKGGAESQA